MFYLTLKSLTFAMPGEPYVVDLLGSGESVINIIGKPVPDEASATSAIQESFQQTLKAFLDREPDFIASRGVRISMTDRVIEMRVPGQKHGFCDELLDEVFRWDVVELALGGQ